MSAEQICVGRVSALYRYPVKSMRGESLPETQVGWHGLAGDRRYAFLDLSNRGGFPWLTAREFHELVCYEACLRNPAEPNSSPVMVRAPNGQEHPLESDALVEEIARASGRAVRLVHLFSGIHDAAYVSIIGDVSIRTLANGAGIELDPRRFRPNVVVQTTDDKPFLEEGWVGDLLVFGQRDDSAKIRVNRKDVRCAIICLDPDTGHSEPKILKHVVQTREKSAGVYGTTQFPGSIHVGDAVYLVKA